MKNYFFGLLLMMVCVKFSNAQITITSASMPSSGDTIRYSNTSVGGLNYDTTGTNITWDFSNVTPLSQGLEEYKTSLQINILYSVFFGFNSYGLKVLDSLSLGTFTISNVYNFYQNSTSSFRAVGRGLEFGGVPIPANYTNQDEIYQFPLQYFDWDSSNYAVSFTLSTLLDLNVTGGRVNDVEGYGTVITPYGTFDCLKVKTTLYEIDSIMVNSFPLPPITRVTRQYKWITTTEKIPVFEIDGVIIGGNFIPTNARYRDNFIITASGNETAESNAGMVLFPNPASASLTITGVKLNRNDQIVITDAMGKIFYQNYILQYTNEFNIETSKFPSGTYFLQLRNVDTNYTGKFIIE